MLLSHDSPPELVLLIRASFCQRSTSDDVECSLTLYLAAGLAAAGMKPVVAIYSTFLQRGYDQLIHDVALQDLDVTFALDRAGLVGEDGPSHAGSFDFSFLRCIPNLLVIAPSDENETRQLLYTAYQHCGPTAVRYPRGTGPGATIKTLRKQAPWCRGRLD